MEKPSYEELVLAIERINQCKIELNVGLHPKLDKYFNMFCHKLEEVNFRNDKSYLRILLTDQVQDKMIIND
jgi:PHP family Zn ribbon phosphoesterase